MTKDTIFRSIMMAVIFNVRSKLDEFALRKVSVSEDAAELEFSPIGTAGSDN